MIALIFLKCFDIYTEVETSTALQPMTSYMTQKQRSDLIDLAVSIYSDDPDVMREFGCMAAIHDWLAAMDNSSLYNLMYENGWII